MNEPQPPSGSGDLPPSPPPPPPTSTPSPPGSTGEASPDDRTLAMLAHLLGIFTWFVGALVIWLVKKDTSPFVDDQGKEALNFQITMAIANCIAAASMAIELRDVRSAGCVLLPAVWVVNLVFCILAAVAASRGERYRYPLTLRLVQ